MRHVRRVVKRAWESYRSRGFCGFVKAASIYLLNEYRLRRYLYPLSLKAKVVGSRRKEKKRIFYIDYFNPENSNFYWLKAFRKFGEVRTFDIVKENRELLRERIMSFNPHHIHLGGSVKSGIVPLPLLSDVKRELTCNISVFYGDCLNSPYHSELAKVVNYIYVSNKTHVKINEEKGLNNFKYMLCPTDPDIFNDQKYKKVFDIVFIGNNNQPSRLPLLRKLADNFNFMIFGNGWEETGLNHGKPVYGREFSKVCSKAKICIGILDPKWTELEAYFSNRLVNTLATRSFYIQRYTPGLENVFTNLKHLVWYTDESKLIRLIKYYLNNEKEREKIATEGQKKVYENYTYEKSVKRILEDTNQKRKLKLHLGSGSSHLKGYVNIDKHNTSADRIMDACKLNYPDNSVDEIFTSHMVEHLTYSEFMDALREWRRVLNENGTLIIRCPNFEKHLRDWLNADYKKRWCKNNEGVNVILGFQDRGPGYPNRNIFTVRRLKDLVSQGEFKILECHTQPTRDGAILDGDILLKAKKDNQNKLDKDWQEALANPIRRKGRFSLQWYKDHPITEELLNSNVLEGKVIDLGCGIGVRAFLAAQKIKESEIIGVDASRYAIRYATDNFKLSNLHFSYADLLKLPFKDYAFDNAYMLAVIEHIADTNALLREIKRVLKSNGKLFLSVTDRDYHSSPDHVHIFSKKLIKNILIEHNLKILDIYVKEHIIFALAKVN
jgi:ubiquinone/menaquinone biosynthesis C-methylase UbiE